MDDIARLEAEIADLRVALARLSSLPEMQAQVQARLAERQALLEQIQSGGASLGAGNTVGQIGTIIGGDQVSHTVYQFVLSGDPAQLPALLEGLRRAAARALGAGFDVYQGMRSGWGAPWWMWTWTPRTACVWPGSPAATRPPSAWPLSRSCWARCGGASCRPAARRPKSWRPAAGATAS